VARCIGLRPEPPCGISWAVEFRTSGYNVPVAHCLLPGVDTPDRSSSRLLDNSWMGRQTLSNWLSNRPPRSVKPAARRRLEIPPPPPHPKSTVLVRRARSVPVNAPVSLIFQPLRGEQGTGNREQRTEETVRWPAQAWGRELSAASSRWLFFREWDDWVSYGMKAVPFAGVRGGSEDR
jgi:hypothetical protein